MADARTNGGDPPALCSIHSDRLDSLDRRMSAVEDGQLLMARDVSSLSLTIGRAPDIATGAPGSGMAQVVYRMASALTQRGAMPSLVDADDEGEITRVQDREELLVRAKTAEAELRARDRQSERVRADRRDRWRVIIAIVAALGGGAGVTELLRQLIGG